MHIGREAVEELIARAFSGITLGGGISLRQAQVIDRYGEGVTDAEFDALPQSEITQDWSRVPLDELERNCVAHLDEAGFRYYLPALMLSILSNYDPASMRVIGTIQALRPAFTHPGYHEKPFRVLSDEQRTAVAHFLQELPALVSLDTEDEKLVSRALRDYWQQFLRVDVQAPNYALERTRGG
jgi:hypothetical protein